LQLDFVVFVDAHAEWIDPAEPEGLDVEGQAAEERTLRESLREEGVGLEPGCVPVGPPAGLAHLLHEQDCVQPHELLQVEQRVGLPQLHGVQPRLHNLLQVTPLRPHQRVETVREEDVFVGLVS